MLPAHEHYLPGGSLQLAKLKACPPTGSLDATFRPQNRQTAKGQRPMLLPHSTKIRLKWGLMALGVLCCCLAGRELWAAAGDLQKIHTAVHKQPHFTQLVFFVKGARPTKIGAVAPDEYAIEFQQLATRLASEHALQDPASTVGAIKIVALPGSPGQIRIQFRQPESNANHRFLPATPPRKGFYRLAVNVSPPMEAKPSGPSKDNATDSAPPPPPTKTEAPPVTQEPVPHPSPQFSKEEEGAKANFSEALQAANRSFDQGDCTHAYALYEQFMNSPAAGRDEMAAALYGLADSYYCLHEKEPAKNGVEILSNYAQALKADPAASHTPWAYYRSGLTCEALGEQKRASENYELVITKFPNHPAVPLCLLGLGRTFLQQALYLDALKTFRSLLRYPLDKATSAQAYWRLGETFYLIGEHPQAIEALQKSMEQDPTICQSEPLLLKYLGESLFVEKQYDKSNDCMFWYLNLAPKTANRDLILARIAEIFTIQDEKNLANKLYTHIQNNYPNSEGDVIAKIRRAEYLESRDKITQEEALSIYRDLLQTPLPAALSRLVHFKFALRQFEWGNFQDCIKILDDSLQDLSSKAPADDLMALRGKAVLDWARQAYAKKDYARTIQLYENNGKLFAAANSLELDLLIAESYGKLKLYRSAIELYQQIVNRQAPKKDEQLLLTMADYFCQAGEFDKAAQLCAQIQTPALQLDKVQLMARIYFAQNQYAKVIETLNALPDKDKNGQTVDWYTMYGESLLRLGAYDKAIPWLDKALDKIKEDSQRVHERVHLCISQGTCYSGLKQLDKAVAVLEEASSLTDSAETRDRLNYEVSRLYLELGQTEKATQKLTKLLESTQGFWQTAARQQLEYMQLQGK
jgi:tetratricopeptide (TPR) repeat protein